MGVVDRLRRQELADRLRGHSAESSPREPSGSSTLAVSDPPIVKRLRGVMTMVQSFIASNPGNDARMGRMTWVISALADEMVDELSERDTTGLESWLAHLGLVIEWVGHGRNELLPPSLKQLAEVIQPTAPIPGPPAVPPMGDPESASHSVAVSK